MFCCPQPPAPSPQPPACRTRLCFGGCVQGRAAQWDGAGWGGGKGPFPTWVFRALPFSHLGTRPSSSCSLFIHLEEGGGVGSGRAGVGWAGLGWAGRGKAGMARGIAGEGQAEQGRAFPHLGTYEDPLCPHLPPHSSRLGFLPLSIKKIRERRMKRGGGAGYWVDEGRERGREGKMERGKDGGIESERGEPTGATRDSSSL